MLQNQSTCHALGWSIVTRGWLGQQGTRYTDWQMQKKKCMGEGISQCKALECTFSWGITNCRFANTTNLTNSYGTITYIPTSDCYDVPQYYVEPEELAGQYNICGEPQCSNETKDWATRECSITIQSCGGSPEDVTACVEDVCSDAQAGVEDPFNITDAYCDPFPELEELLNNLSNSSNSTNPTNPTDPNPDPELTTTTTTQNSAWCSGETGITRVNKPGPCLFPPTLEQCHAYAQKEYGENARVGAPWDIEGNIGGCFAWYQFNVGWIGFNRVGHDGAGSSAYTRLCCGSETVVPTTTTTTTTPWQQLVINGTCCTEPPLRPYNESEPLDALDFAGDVTRSCRLHNDPHIDTFDRVRVSFFSVGNYWVVKSNELWIQSRFAPRGLIVPGRSFVKKVAIGGPLLEGNTMMIEETLGYFWNEQFINVISGTGISFMNGRVNVSYLHRSAMYVQLPFGIQIMCIKRGASFPSTGWLQLKIKMRQLSGQDGFCGNNDGDRSNEVVADMIATWGQKIPKGSSQALIPY
mmetsp:Transcript_90738/g.158530  ORF Transcript_90738/g.158530 Transcript_90738/m.158530 type:complete len:524 (-) Transcript_90738:194-1765(-)